MFLTCSAVFVASGCCPEVGPLAIATVGKSGGGRGGGASLLSVVERLEGAESLCQNIDTGGIR